MNAPIRRCRPNDRLGTALLLLCLAGCGPDAGDWTARELVGRIPEGATIEEVRAQVGSPSESRDLGGGKEAHVYQASDRKVVVLLADGHVVSARATDRVEFR